MKQKTNTSITNIENINVGNIKKTNLQKGITLISLVITIIILLILAGVAISLAIDSNGLFARAKKAAEDWNTSVINEQIAIDNILQMADEVESTIMPKGWNADVISKIVVQGGRKAPIPKGYAVSQIPGEDKIEDGLVIYEGDDPVTGEKDEEEHKAAMRDRNQYVWIPVDNINSMVMCQDHPSGSLDTETALCTTCKESTPLVGKLYTSLSSGSTSPQLSFNPNSGYREPAIVTGDSTGNGSQYDGAINESFGLGTAEVFLAHLKEEFSNMAKSVAKYKGFYISRYEIQAGAASKKGANVLNNGTSSGNSWYGLYTTIQNSTTHGSTTPQMIWGCQYDQIMMHVDEKPDGAGATFDVQTASSTRKRTSGEASGNNSADLVCNIYDLENNYYEWTAEAGSADGRVVRGGNFNYSVPASNRVGGLPTYAIGIYSSRSALYVTL